MILSSLLAKFGAHSCVVDIILPNMGSFMCFLAPFPRRDP